MHKIMLFLLLITIISCGSMGCAQLKTAEETAPTLDLNIKQAALSIAVLDKRPYILSNKKSTAFEGLVRSQWGIPFSQKTPTKEPMSTYLGKRLEAGFHQRGIQVNRIKTDPFMTIDEIIQQSRLHQKSGIIIVLHEWKYDTHLFIDNSWFNVQILVVDETGKKNIVKRFAGQDDIPATLARYNEMQKIYKKRFETIFSDKDIRKALLL